MDNRKESFDQRFLAPLKHRPDLEPDESFIEKLRSELIEGRKVPISGNRSFRWPILVPVVMTVMLFTLLTASLIGSKSESEQSQPVKTIDAEKKDKSEEERSERERDIYTITGNNEAFQQIYQTVTKSTGSPNAARELVFYFDALQQGDEVYIKDVLLYEYYDNNINEVLKYYEKVDFSTINVEMVEIDEKGRELVTFTFVDKETKTQVKRRLLLDMSDEKNIRIFDSIGPEKNNAIKDEKVKEKAEYLEKNFRLGMTEEEVKTAFGQDFNEFVNADAEDGSVKDWLYQFYVDKGTVSKVPDKGIVDFENLRSQNIGIQFWIGWSPEEKVMRMSMFYTLNGKVFAKLLRSDGSLVVEEQRSGEVLLDSTPFKLDEQEMLAYELFKQNHSSKHLKDLPPLSIAKLYVQARLDSDPETEYALYTTRSEHVRWSKAEHIQDSSEFSSSSEEILAAFQGIQGGEFVETSDYEGYLKFESKNGVQGFRLIKDLDGVWKVGFMPIQ